ncbi:MAG: hypothetical protein K6F34_09315 [Lachnospiraceae bacterium]|nr:hypothetical protein [Lachnospiraceae bacterium]
MLSKTQQPDFDPLIITDRETGRKYYGGDQDWYKSNTRAFAGCGSVACANMLRTLAVKYPDKFTGDKVSDDLGKLAAGDCYRDDFLSLMSGIYKTMLVIEMPFIRRIYDLCRRGNKLFKRLLIPSFGLGIGGFIRGCLKYCRSRGLMLHMHSLPTAFCPYDRGLKFIEEGLEKCGSVVMLTSYNRHPLKLYSGESGRLENGYDSRDGVRSHFMTITGIVREENGEPLIKLSTWGRVATVPYDKLNRSWHLSRAYTSCLYYLTPTASETVVRADLRHSFKVMIRAFFLGAFGRFIPSGKKDTA